MKNITVKQIDLTEYFDQLLAIWRTCFPEDADFGETFLTTAATKAVVFGALQDDALVSCAYCLPCDFNDANVQFSAYYVYGVGTLPTHQGQGLAKAVLAYIENNTLVDALYLYPAQPSLRSFYERLGYRSVLCRNEQHIVSRAEDTALSYDIKPFDASLYAAKRNVFLRKYGSLYATFDITILQTLLEHAQLLSFNNATAVCITDNDTVYIPELLCDAKCVSSVLSAIKQVFPTKEVIVYMAGTDTESGMVLPLSATAKIYFNKQNKVSFFGTFFAE